MKRITFFFEGFIFKSHMTFLIRKVLILLSKTIINQIIINQIIIIQGIIIQGIIHILWDRIHVVDVIQVVTIM